MIVIFVAGDNLRTVPYNIPEHLLNKLNGCISQRDIEELQERILLAK